MTSSTPSSADEKRAVGATTRGGGSSDLLGHRSEHAGRREQPCGDEQEAWRTDDAGERVDERAAHDAADNPTQPHGAVETVGFGKVTDVVRVRPERLDDDHRVDVDEDVDDPHEPALRDERRTADSHREPVDE